jgi:hypothetical protein
VKIFYDKGSKSLTIGVAFWIGVRLTKIVDSISQKEPRFSRLANPSPVLDIVTYRNNRYKNILRELA